MSKRIEREAPLVRNPSVLCPPSRGLKASRLSRVFGRRADPFELLVRAHHDRVFDFCLRMLRDGDEASDLVQETFTSVYQHLGSFREESSLSTWIFRIAKNLCLNRLTYLKRHGLGRSWALDHVSEEALHAAQPGPEDPAALLQVAAERARVQRGIAQLGEEHRVLVILRDIEGLSYGEISKVMELPEGTVKSRLHRARERLAELLAEGEEP